jgi:hypothetical protein
VAKLFTTKPGKWILGTLRTSSRKVSRPMNKDSAPVPRPCSAITCVVKGAGCAELLRRIGLGYLLNPLRRKRPQG